MGTRCHESCLSCTNRSSSVSHVLKLLHGSTRFTSWRSHTWPSTSFLALLRDKTHQLAWTYSRHGSSRNRHNQIDAVPPIWGRHPIHRLHLCTPCSPVRLGAVRNNPVKPVQRFARMRSCLQRLVKVHLIVGNHHANTEPNTRYYRCSSSIHACLWCCCHPTP